LGRGAIVIKFIKGGGYESGCSAGLAGVIGRAAAMRVFVLNLFGTRCPQLKGAGLAGAIGAGEG